MKQDTIHLGEFDYVCTALSARVGMRVAAKLANALAPAVKELPEEGFEFSGAAIAKLVEPILTNPELSDTFDYLIDTFSAATLVRPAGAGEGGTPLARVFDLQFADAYDDLIAWLLFSVKLSLSSFFRGARGLGALFAQAGQASKSPKAAETTGQSGG